MKATELRVGNLVSVDGKNLTVTQIFEKGLNCGNVGALYELVKPIPLTEEWLERFGFDSIALGYEIDDRFITLRPEEDENGGFDVFVMTANIEQPMYITYIDYVHQLQNLYFALTGEELNQNKEDE